MNKKIVFGCILAATLLLLMPSVSSIQTQVTESETIENLNDPNPLWSSQFGIVAIVMGEDYEVFVEGEPVDPRELSEDEVYNHVTIKGKITEETFDYQVFSFTGYFSFYLTVFWLMIIELIVNNDFFLQYYDYFLSKIPGAYSMPLGEFVIVMNKMDDFSYTEKVNHIGCRAYDITVYPEVQ